MGIGTGHVRVEDSLHGAFNDTGVWETRDIPLNDWRVCDGDTTVNSALPGTATTAVPGFATRAVTLAAGYNDLPVIQWIAASTVTARLQFNWTVPDNYAPAEDALQLLALVRKFRIGGADDATVGLTAGMVAWRPPRFDPLLGDAVGPAAPAAPSAVLVENYTMRPRLFEATTTDNPANVLAGPATWMLFNLSQGFPRTEAQRLRPLDQVVLTLGPTVTVPTLHTIDLFAARLRYKAHVGGLQNRDTRSQPYGRPAF